jgi:hypothetical protein
MTELNNNTVEDEQTLAFELLVEKVKDESTDEEIKKLPYGVIF